jgi:hypothetical protein
MSQAKPEKRIRITQRGIERATGAKKGRLEAKVAYLRGLRPSARFEKGPKQLGEGGYI